MSITESGMRDLQVSERLSLLQANPEAVAKQDAGEILKRFAALTEARRSGFLAYFVHGVQGVHDLTHDYLRDELGLPSIDDGNPANVGQPEIVFEADNCMIVRNTYIVDENGGALDSQYDVICVPDQLAG